MSIIVAVKKAERSYAVVWWVDDDGNSGYFVAGPVLLYFLDKLLGISVNKKRRTAVLKGEDAELFLLLAKMAREQHIDRLRKLVNKSKNEVLEELRAWGAVPA